LTFEPLSIPGAFKIGLELLEDERGFFARTFCQREFELHGLAAAVAQCNVSRNAHRGTLRGMHFQREPSPEAKLVRCTRGVAYDVVLDLRAGSSTYRQWAAVELSGENRVAVYVPAGCGHGFQTLCDDTEVFYQMSEFYDPALASGVRWNDSCFGIHWPIATPILSPRDASYPDFQP
jgi:dTDP-4-dehydrorhamnose 3,5-epimerase